MIPPNAGPAGMYLPSAHHLRRFNGSRNRPQRSFNIDHHALSQAGRRTYPYAGNFENPIFIALADYGADFSRPYIEADN
jgi:hypothetical protein